MKRLAVLMLLVVVCGAAILWIRRERWQSALRVRVEQAVSASVGVPVMFGSFSLGVRPLHISATDVQIGDNPMLGGIDGLEVQLSVAESLQRRRPVLSVRVIRPSMDLTQQLSTSTSDDESTATHLHFPEIELSNLEIRELRLRFPMDDETSATLSVESVTASAASRIGSIDGKVELVGAELEHKIYHARVHRLSAVGGWKETGLFIETARVEGEAIDGEAHASAAGVDATLSFDPALLGVVVDELSTLRGQATLTGTLRGDMADPLVDAQLRIIGGSLAGRALGDLQARFRRDGARLEFDDVVLRGPKGEARGSVDLTLRREVPINADVTCQGIDLQRVLEAAGAAVPISLHLDGALRLRGALDPLDLAVAGNGHAFHAERADVAIGSWRASTRILPHSVDIAAEVTQEEGNRIAADLTIDVGSFNGSGLLQAKDLRPLNALLPTPVGALAMSGQATATVGFSGSTDHPEVRATLTTNDLTVMGSRVPRLEGALRIAHGTMTTENVRVDSANGSLVLSGDVALTAAHENDATLTLRNFDTDVLVSFLQSATGSRLPLTNGAVDGSARLRGTWSQLVGQTAVTARDVRLFGEPMKQLILKAEISAGRWRSSLVANHAADESLTLEAEGDGMRDSRISVAATPLDLGHLIGAGRRGLTGSLLVQGQLSGPPARLGGRVVLQARDLSIQDRSLGDLALQLDGAAGQWRLAVQGLYDALSLDGTFSLEGSQPYTLSGQWVESELSAVVGVDPALRVWSSGRLDIRGSLSSPSQVDGTLEVSTLDLSRDAYHLRAAQPIRLRAERGRVVVESLELAAEDSRIRVSGNFTTAGLFDLGAEGAGDLVLIELVGPPVEAARGPFEIHASLRRSGEGDWVLSGNAAVRGGSLDFGLPVAFTGLESQIRFGGGKIYVDQLSGRAGGGRFQVVGTIDLAHGMDLTWDLDGVSFSISRGLEVRAHGKGTVHGAWGRIVVGGGVEVINALYDRDVGLGDLLAWLQEQLLAVPRGATATSSGVGFDLRIYADGGIYLDNNVAKGEMWLNLHLSGSAAKPTLMGTIGIFDGEVNFRGRKFLVTGGSIDFSDPHRVNPTLNITAESRIATLDTDYVVLATVSGSADNPRVVFSADDPSLTQNDVLSLVAFGKTRAQAQRESTGVTPADALALVPTGAMASRVGELVGVDQFEVTATQARDTGSIEPRVTIGKDLTEQLRAVVWTEFGIVARHSVQLEYRLTRRVSLLGSWESQTEENAGAFEGDVKFRFDFRRIPFSLTGASGATVLQRDARP